MLGVSSGFSGHDVPSSSAFGFVLVVEIAALCSLQQLQAGWGQWSGSATATALSDLPCS